MFVLLGDRLRPSAGLGGPPLGRFHVPIALDAQPKAGCHTTLLEDSTIAIDRTSKGVA